MPIPRPNKDYMQKPILLPRPSKHVRHLRKKKKIKNKEWYNTIKGRRGFYIQTYN